MFKAENINWLQKRKRSKSWLHFVRLAKCPNLAVKANNLT
jgi:hypothetical protein